MASWENWTPSWACGSEDVPWPEDAKCGQYEELSGEEAGEELFLVLVELKVRGTLSAKQCCVLAHLASQAGAVGAVRSLGLRPGRQSGAYSHHFDKVVPGSSNDLAEYYQVSVPLNSRADAGRVSGVIPMQLPHEAFTTEFLESSVASEAMKEALSSNTLPPAYFEHEVVRNRGPDEIVHPLCLYMDGVAYTRTDSLLGVWCYHLLTGVRHLVTCIRKSELCSCGCRGWDSLYPLLSAIAWSFRAMALGRHPDHRHDSAPWREEDVGRASFANESFGWKAICFLIKGDWAEYAHSLGFPTHADTQAPCPMCCCNRGNMYSTRGYGPAGLEHRNSSLQRYETACLRCEIQVVVQPEDYHRIRAALVYDVRPHGQRGRALSADFPKYGLQKNDRLEPIPTRPDPGAFDSAVPPVDCLWWRSSRDTVARRRNPLFGPGTFITPSCLSVDWLHTFSLGVFQFFLGPLLWQLFLANAFRVDAPASALGDASLNRLRELLSEWYTSESRQGRHHTKIQNITMGMIGTPSEPEMKLHAAETNGMVHFLSDVLDEYGSVLGNRRGLWRCGLDELLEMLRVFRTYQSVVPDDAVATFCKIAKSHLQLCEKLGIRLRPKHHLMLHVGPRSLHLQAQMLQSTLPQQLAILNCVRGRCR